MDCIGRRGDRGHRRDPRGGGGRAAAKRQAGRHLAGSSDPRGGRSDDRTVIFSYTAMPHGAAPRPLVDVGMDDSGLLVKGLVDTGAVSTLFGAWIADETGV